MSAFITCPVCKHDLLENHEGQRGRIVGFVYASLTKKKKQRKKND